MADAPHSKCGGKPCRFKSGHRHQSHKKPSPFPNWKRVLIVDKPSVCQRGLPGRLSSHCSSIQHGRSTALTSSLVALPASLGLLRPVSRTARGLRAPRLRRPSVPALRTALAFGGAVFRRCGRLLGVSSRLQPLCGLRLRTALRFVCSPLQPFGPPPFASSLAVLPASLGSSAAIAPSIRNGRPAAPYGLQYSRLSVQHGRLSAFAKLT